jgi:hypothetical protein
MGKKDPSIAEFLSGFGAWKCGVIAGRATAAAPNESREYAHAMSDLVHGTVVPAELKKRGE